MHYWFNNETKLFCLKVNADTSQSYMITYFLDARRNAARELTIPFVAESSQVKRKIIPPEPLEGKQSTEGILYHIITDINKFTCCICQISYKKFGYLKLHTQKKHGSSIFIKCPKCAIDTFVSIESFKRHHKGSTCRF